MQQSTNPNTCQIEIHDCNTWIKHTVACFTGFINLLEYFYDPPQVQKIILQNCLT